MKLLSATGTAVIFLDANNILQEISVAQIVNPQLLGLTDWKIGVTFYVSEIMCEIKLNNTLAIGSIPVIYPEDSRAKKIAERSKSSQNSEKIGIGIFINDKLIASYDAINYGIVQNISLLYKITTGVKKLGSMDSLSFQLLNLGKGIDILEDDYISISVDYSLEINGFKPQEDLLVKF